MTNKTILAALLAAIVCLAFALPAAHAGGGMGTGSGATTCRLVLNGSQNQPQAVSVIDPFVNGDLLKVNALALLCDLPAIGVTKSGPATGTPVPEAQRTTVACYTVSGADSARVLATIHTPFTEATPPLGGGEHVALGAIQLLCVPAVTTAP